MIIENLDIKTLRLLIAIADNGSVSTAASQRGMTQSTASYGLEKLRLAFSDPLFVRSGRGMTTTEVGKRIVKQCKEILHRLDNLCEQNTFNQETTEREFVIAATAYEIEIIVVPLFRLLSTLVPNARLIALDLDLLSLEEKLQDEWDLALVMTPKDSSAIKRLVLFEETYATFYDPETNQAPHTLDDFCAAPHIIVSWGGEPIGQVDAALDKIGRNRKVKIVVNGFEALAHVMRGTDMIANIPVRLSKNLMRDFAYVPCPLTLPRLPIQMVWHVSKDTDAGNIWLRQQIKALNAVKYS